MFARLQRQDWLWEGIHLILLSLFFLWLVVYLIYVPFDPILARCKHLFFYLAGLGVLDGLLLFLLLGLIAYQELVGGTRGPFSYLKSQTGRLSVRCTNAPEQQAQENFELERLVPAQGKRYHTLPFLPQIYFTILRSLASSATEKPRRTTT